MKKIKTLIVDDSALIRELLKSMLSGQPDIEVVDTAVDPFDAREKIKLHNPDVVTLDIEMPKMDGLSFLEKIMTLRPMPVVMVSTLTQKGASETLRALEIGAFDYISKPTGAIAGDIMKKLETELLEKVRGAARANMSMRRQAKAEPSASSVLKFTPPAGAGSIIAIGSSTGGVEALRDIFQVLPANSPPIVIVQHMPAQFTPSFAARLDSLSKVTVCEAKTGMKLQQGHALLAPGGKHLSVVKSGKDWVCEVVPGEPVSGHCPSVDVMFNSVAEKIGARAVGVILTGMGRDGAAGMLKMRESGAYNIGQNESSCVVYGMPKAAMAAGGVHTELPLSDIPAHMLAFCERERKSAHAS